MRHIAVVTTTRADYGIYQSVLAALQAHPSFRVSVIVGGMHLSPEFGNTVQQIELDGYTIAARVELLLSSDTPTGIALSMGMGTMGYAQALARIQPDLLVVLGDRFEMHAAALAALPFRIPVAHIHGGELTFGAMDDALRHSMTKLSHLHFPATAEYARRIIQLGEEPWRVTVSGAPALDQIATLEFLSQVTLTVRCGLPLDPAPLLVTYHPVTLEYDQTPWQTGELLAALHESAYPVIFTLPNADTNGRVIIQLIHEYVREHANAVLVDNLGTPAYFSLLRHVAVMVGNSSSGLIEAPSFRLPVVNIGTRQQGRTRATNVIDVGYTRQEIAHGIRTALTPVFRASLADLVNPYGGGTAADIIVARLADVSIDQRLIEKHFYDQQPLPSGQETG